jgi:hypothetical protein
MQFDSRHAKQASVFKTDAVPGTVLKAIMPLLRVESVTEQADHVVVTHAGGSFVCQLGQHFDASIVAGLLGK